MADWRVLVTSRRQATLTAMDTLYNQIMIGQALCFVLDKLDRRAGCRALSSIEPKKTACIERKSSCRSLDRSMKGCNTGCFWIVEHRDLRMNCACAHVTYNSTLSRCRANGALLKSAPRQSLFNGLKKSFAVWTIPKSAVAFRDPNNRAAFIRDAAPLWVH